MVAKKKKPVKGKAYVPVGTRRQIIREDLLTSGYLPHTQKEYATRFRCSHQLISKDVKFVKQQVLDELEDAPESDFFVQYKMTRDKLIAEGDLVGAWKVTLQYWDWRFNLGKSHKEPEKVEVKHGSLREDLMKAAESITWEEAQEANK